MGGKRTLAGPLPEYLVLYHLNHVIRYEEDELLWPLCVGYLVLYHGFHLSPCFYIGIPANKVSGVLFHPGVLRGLFPFLLTLGIGTCLLPLLHPMIGDKELSTEKTLFGHRLTPPLFFCHSINGYGVRRPKKPKKPTSTTEERYY